MKYRKDFVTNSSSSSFICEICGRTEVAYDMGLSYAEMYGCIYGHVFCEDEALNPDSDDMINHILSTEDLAKNYTKSELKKMNGKDLLDIIINENGNNDVPECMCPICKFEVYSEYDMCRYLLKENKLRREQVVNKVRGSIKNKREITDGEIILYLCTKLWLKTDDAVESWKTEFGTYQKLIEYLRN